MRYWKIKRLLNNYLREKKYYEAWINLIDEFYSYFKFDCVCYKIEFCFSIICLVLYFIILFGKDLIDWIDGVIDGIIRKIRNFYNRLFNNNNSNRNQINNNLGNENNITVNQNKKIPNKNNLTKKNKKKLTNDENLKKIVKFLKEQKHNEEVLNALRDEVLNLTSKHPLWYK